MPNWSCGHVEVTGSQKNVTEFCKLFIWEDREIKSTDNYFARSFTNQNWDDFEEEQILINSHREEKEISVSFGIQFAWSGHSCLIDGYPTREEGQGFKQCITIIEAIKKYPVKVFIEADEPGMGFTEEYTFEKDGTWTDDTNEYLDFECEHCKEICSFSDLETANENTCWKCDKEGAWTLK